MLHHTFHLLTPRPWPILASLGGFVALRGVTILFHLNLKYVFSFRLLLVFSIIFIWWRDVIREGLNLGRHTVKVKEGLGLGILLFITSEIFFFLAFFWAYFHRRLSPAHEVGCDWPPVGVYPLNAFSVPLLNTAILLASGATVTWAHYGLINNFQCETNWGLWVTIILGLYFSYLQYTEYQIAFYGFNDSVYGSTFFIATGFHGLHVLVGSSFLLVCWIRSLFNTFSSEHHFGLEAAAWYWHFVDVVWIFLYLSLYWWSSI